MRPSELLRDAKLLLLDDGRVALGLLPSAFDALKDDIHRRIGVYLVQDQVDHKQSGRWMSYNGVVYVRGYQI